MQDVADQDGDPPEIQPGFYTNTRAASVGELIGLLLRANNSFKSTTACAQPCEPLVAEGKYTLSAIKFRRSLEVSYIRERDIALDSQKYQYVVDPSSGLVHFTAKSSPHREFDVAPTACEETDCGP
jgi:hypothetical protein